jgi:hypothetical protein
MVLSLKVTRVCDVVVPADSEPGSRHSAFGTCSVAAVFTGPIEATAHPHRFSITRSGVGCRNPAAVIMGTSVASPSGVGAARA